MSTKATTSVAEALTTLGESAATWRRLRQLTIEQVAERAEVSRHTVMKLEHGDGVTLENFLRITCALGVLDQVTSSIDPRRGSELTPVAEHGAATGTEGASASHLIPGPRQVLRRWVHRDESAR